jgi:hypothetical protein
LEGVVVELVMVVGGVVLSGVQEAALDGLNGILASVKAVLSISYNWRARCVGTHIRMSSTYSSIAYGVGEVMSYSSGVWILAVA